MSLPTFIDKYSVISKDLLMNDGVRISSCVRIEHNCIIEENTFIGHGVVMRPYTHIGKNCKIGHYTVFEGRCEIGDDCIIQAQSNITRGAKIGNKVFIGMMFCGGNDKPISHQRWHYYGEFVPNAFIIEDFVRIGFRVDVVPGVVIRKNAFIAAGTLVTKDVPENSRVKGRPGEIYGVVPEDERL